MPSLAVTPEVCGVPGCPEPRLALQELCPCDEDGCPERHVQSECCERHTRNCGRKLWLPNDGLIDRRAIDMVIHDERTIRLTWTEGLIVVATLLAVGYSANEATRRLGLSAGTYWGGPFRNPSAKDDIARAVAAISGEPLPPPIPRVPRKSDPARYRRRRANATPEQKAREAARNRTRRAAWTPEQKAKAVARALARRARETPEQREARLRRDREAQAARRRGEVS